MRKYMILCFFWFVCASCTTTSQKTPVPQIINLGDSFFKFWQLAENKSFEEQLQLWDKLVENPNQAIFDDLVNSKNISTNWQEQKRKRLKIFFSKIKTNLSAYRDIFNNFEDTVSLQISRYKKQFPDAVFDIPIYAVPGATFNGSAAYVNEYKKTVLGFGVDIIVDINDDTDVLYSHELFHIYHEKKMNLENLDTGEIDTITLPLWKEGLAAYASQVMNPGKPTKAVLMSKELAAIEVKNLNAIAKLFLNDAAVVDSQKNYSKYTKWFTLGGKPPSPYPSRVGYFLGFKVAEKLSTKYSLAEMSSWSATTANTNVLKALKEIANLR